MDKVNKISLLLVEDDLLTQRTTKRLLSPFGDVKTASTADEAMAFMRSQTFDVAFFDLNLNGELAGLELIKAAKMIGLYSIVVSGEPRESVLEIALTNGAKDFLDKPFNDEKLEQVMARFFNNRKHINFENIINKNFITKSQKQMEELYKIKNLPIPRC